MNSHTIDANLARIQGRLDEVADRISNQNTLRSRELKGLIFELGVIRKRIELEALASRPAMMPEWVSVAERLPLEDEPVLLYVPCNTLLDKIKIGYLYEASKDGQWFYISDRASALINDMDGIVVTHWMPLPQAAPDHFAAANKGEK